MLSQRGQSCFETIPSRIDTLLEGLSDEYYIAAIGRPRTRRIATVSYSS